MGCPLGEVAKMMIFPTKTHGQNWGPGILINPLILLLRCPVFVPQRHYQPLVLDTEGEPTIVPAARKWLWVKTLYPQ